MWLLASLGAFSNPSPAQGNRTLGAEWVRATNHAQLVFAEAALVPDSGYRKHRSRESPFSTMRLKACSQRAESKLPAKLQGNSYSHVKGGLHSQMECKSARFTGCCLPTLDRKGSLRSFSTTDHCIVEETESFK